MSVLSNDIYFRCHKNRSSEYYIIVDSAKYELYSVALKLETFHNNYNEYLKERINVDMDYITPAMIAYALFLFNEEEKQAFPGELYKRTNLQEWHKLEKI